MVKEFIVEYDGDYPNLCSGQLVVTIEGTVWDFGRHCLSTGGGVAFDEDWNESVWSGPWTIHHFPEGFPEDLKQETEYYVNAQIDHGCCGGCV